MASKPKRDRSDVSLFDKLWLLDLKQKHPKKLHPDLADALAKHVDEKRGSSLKAVKAPRRQTVGNWL